MNRQLKDVLLIGLVVVVPGMWAFWLAKKILADVNEKKSFRDYVRKTYGNASNYVELP